MKTVILAVGRIGTHPLAGAVAEYVRRAARFAPLEVREIPPGRGGEAAATAAREGERLLAAIGPSDRVILCDERGEEHTTAGFARLLEREDARGGSGRLIFVLGGAEGLAPAVRDRADGLLALSRLTLPHELARLVLAEQIYRARSLLAGHPYHRAGAPGRRKPSK
jgi:23S rRNA (pseudouridine1915-N3)-methyltransferase